MTENQKPKKLQKLTKKQRGFVNDYVLTENGTQAVLKNYNINSKHGTKQPNIVAANIATENLSKPYIINAIEVKRKSLKMTLIDKGIDEDKVADTIQELLDATDDKGNRDYTAKDKGIKHVLTIYGIEDPSDKPSQQNTYNFIFSKDVQDEVKEIEQRIKNKLLKKNETISED